MPSRVPINKQTNEQLGDSDVSQSRSAEESLLGGVGVRRPGGLVPGTVFLEQRGTTDQAQAPTRSWLSESTASFPAHLTNSSPCLFFLPLCRKDRFLPDSLSVVLINQGIHPTISIHRTPKPRHWGSIGTRSAFSPLNKPIFHRGVDIKGI